MALKFKTLYHHLGNSPLFKSFYMAKLKLSACRQLRLQRFAFSFLLFIEAHPLSKQILGYRLPDFDFEFCFLISMAKLKLKFLNH